MKIAYFDCFSGISGDMILGAIVDLGVSLSELKRELDKLKLTGYKLEVKPTNRGVIQGSKVEIKLPSKSQPLRNLTHIKQIIDKSLLSAYIKQQASHIFERLAEAEAKVHGVKVEAVHFHEVGALDTIIDVVGAVAGLTLLGIDKVIASPINVGAGMVETQHGSLPIPAPATIELLKGIGVYSSGADFELVTPTGAAIITSLAQDYGPYPAMRLEAVGYGAGDHDIETTPNMLRIAIGEGDQGYLQDQLIVLETDIDDMNPEWYAWVMGRAFEVGAVDVAFTPIYMKQNRPACRITLLSPPPLADNLAELLLTETTSLGVRRYTVQRTKLDRHFEEVETEFGRIKLKVAKINGELKNIAPEHEDCKRVAREQGRTLKEVYQAAVIASSNIIS